MRLVDLLYRTAVYVIRMYGGVGGEEPRGFPLSRLETIFGDHDHDKGSVDDGTIENLLPP
jgi:hypothetical protein